jgi:hypothetical protein
MSNYTKSTNFASKDNLASGNPAKIVKGTEIDTEFNNIATAIATKQDSSTAGDVTLTGTQTLTNKTITYADNTLTGVAGTTATQTLTNKTITNIVFDGSLTEEVFAFSGTVLEPDNGTVQTITLSANTTFTDSLATGQSMILGIDDGSAYTVTWPTITWTTTPAAAPTLPTSGFLWVVLWKVGSTLYGKY